MTNGDIKIAPAKSGRKDRSLLIVDSDIQHLSYLSQLLQRLEYKTNTAKTAREALDTADASVPNLIITALNLSDMSGLNFMQLMRGKPTTSNTPYIVIKKPEDTGEVNYYRAGAASCLSKPVAIESLYQAVQAAVETTPRTSIRLRTIQPVKVDTVPFDNYAGMHTLALSERGMFLHSMKQAPENTRLALRINLSGLIIAAETKVLYNGKSNRGPYQEPGMGLEFVQISPKDREFIRKFIRNEVTRGIEPVNGSPYSA
jgi:CheY-like chemotaxis protein